MRLRTHSGWLVILAFVIGLTSVGCQRQRAETTLRKTTQKISDIKQNYDGLKHEPDRINAIEQKIDQANQTLATDAGQALSLANEAKAQTEQVYEAVKPAQANALFSQAEQEIAVARLNDLPRRDSERFQRVGDLKGQADTSRGANKWDDMIKYSRQIIDEVKTGLSPLKNEADRKRTDAEQRLTDLNREGGRIYVPEVVIAVEDDITRAKQISDADRDYILAANRFQDAKNKAEQGINMAMREKAREHLEEIEGFITSAVLEGVKQFKQQDYDKIIKQYEGLVADYNAGAYSRVITGAEQVTPQAKTLVVETKRAASDDRILLLQSNIRELEDGGILEYIPDSLGRLRDLLAQATQIRRNDDEPSFDQIKQLSIRASDEYDRQRGAFESLANDRIREARDSLDKSRAVFDQMDRIFDAIDGPMSEDELAFENQKKTRQVELGKQLEDASNALIVADQRKNQSNFRGAIVLAGDVRKLSDNTLSEIYHTVAHNASIELAKLISRYEREGARQYAPDELARATSKLEDVKGSTASREYQRAVAQSAEARADVELMAQRIAGRANEDILEARKALESASSERTRRFRPNELAQVAALIGEASADLQADRLKPALEKASSATTLARTAETEAAMLSAQEGIAKATAGLTRAQSAGAESYAGREMEDARRLLGSSRALFASGDFVKADELAASSITRSQNALYKNIDEADREIATATAVGGWNSKSGKLASANNKARQARALLDQGEYAKSSKLAASAESTARGVSKSAKRANFNDRVDVVKGSLSEGTEQGINFFQTDESIRARRGLTDLRNQYSSKEYDRVMKEIEGLEASLRETLSKTPEVVETAADNLDRRLTTLVDAGAASYAAPEIEEAKNGIRFARLDYRRGAYRSAHSNLTKAAKLTRLTEFRKAHTEYSADLRGMFEEYRALQLKFQNVLTLDPTELKALAVGTNGAAQSVAISAQITPSQFRNAVEGLYARSLELKSPENMEDLHQLVVAAFAEGRLAAIYFERLSILNRMAVDEAHRVIDQGYYRMNNSNRMVTDIQNQLIYDEVRFRLARVNSAAITNSIE